MIPLRTRILNFSRHVWLSALGIAAELVLVAVFILVGLAVCLVWWGLFR
jgi:hypothetical protein